MNILHCSKIGEFFPLKFIAVCNDFFYVVGIDCKRHASEVGRGSYKKKDDKTKKLALRNWFIFPPYSSAGSQGRQPICFTWHKFNIIR